MYINDTTKEQKEHKVLVSENPLASVPANGTAKILSNWYNIFPTSIVYNKDTHKQDFDNPLMVGSKYEASVIELTQDEIDANFKATVPVQLSMRQARLALLGSGLLAIVDTAVANSSDEAMKIEWEYSDVAKRDWTSLVAMATSLGMSELDLDNLFILGGTL